MGKGTMEKRKAKRANERLGTVAKKWTEKLTLDVTKLRKRIAFIEQMKRKNQSKLRNQQKLYAYRKAIAEVLSIHKGAQS